MIRTVWLAAFCLAGLGGLCASKVTASIYPTEDSVPAQTVSNPFDTLTEADTAPVAPSRAPAEVTFSIPMQSADVLPYKPAKIKAKRLTASNLRLKAAMAAKRAAKIRLSKNINQDKAAAEPGNCYQADGLSGLLKSFASAFHCS